VSAALRRRLLAAALAALLGAPAAAHEFWILPDRFSVGRGEAVGIGLVVGTGWPGEPFARQERRVVRFAWIDAGGERVLQGNDGDEPAGRTVATAPGTAIAVYRSTDATAELDAAEFESYLREEGLEHAIAARAARGQAGAPVRERYSRCAKAVLAVRGARRGARALPDVTRPVGLDLEIVPLLDPRTLRRGGALPVRVTWQGAPAEGLLVKALARSDPTLRIAGRTDAGGQAVLQLPAGGTWLVNAVRIEAAPAGADHDWRSTWSSLVFEATPRR
jgi:uncharacterized GH25 family protein